MARPGRRGKGFGKAELNLQHKLTRVHELCRLTPWVAAASYSASLHPEGDITTEQIDWLTAVACRSNRFALSHPEINGSSRGFGKSTPDGPFTRHVGEGAG